ncbi:hypothetical protein PFISCL1PPCAC_23533, partial [Pristionchus fissidentatus]
LRACRVSLELPLTGPSCLGVCCSSTPSRPSSTERSASLRSLSSCTNCRTRAPRDRSRGTVGTTASSARMIPSLSTGERPRSTPLRISPPRSPLPESIIDWIDHSRASSIFSLTPPSIVYYRYSSDK